MELAYQGKYYNILKIGNNNDPEDDPEQYKYFIKEICKPRIPSAQINRDGYTVVENGLEYAKELADDTLRVHFIIPSELGKTTTFKK